MSWKNVNEKSPLTQASGQNLASPGAGFAVLKLDIIPKNKNATVTWNLVSIQGIIPLEKAEELGKIKILKRDNDAIYIQLTKEPKWYKLRRLEWIEGQGVVDIQKYDNVEILIVKQIES
jgi:hypothetical protein